jgi:uncharacterized protein YjbI with pentapeptide repeats
VEVRAFGRKRVLRRPDVDPGELVDSATPLTGSIDIDAENLTGGDFTGVSVRGAISRSELTSVILAESRAGPLTMLDTVLRRVDLSHAEWIALTARRVEILDCRATGWRSTFDLAQDFYMEDCRMDYCVLTIVRAKDLNVFKGCAFRNATIGGDLSNVIFDECLLDGVEFLAHAATGCDLRGSRLDGITGLMSLRGALISPDQAVTLVPQFAAEAGITIAS